MAHLHLTNKYSFRELGRAFGVSDKTAKTHVTPIADAVHAVMNGIPIPVQRIGQIKRKRLIEETEWLERHFILYQILKNPDISDRAISRAMRRIKNLWPKCEWACSSTTVWR
jgi:hypothetical protein